MAIHLQKGCVSIVLSCNSSAKFIAARMCNNLRAADNYRFNLIFENYNTNSVKTGNNNRHNSGQESNLRNLPTAFILLCRLLHTFSVS